MLCILKCKEEVNIERPQRTDGAFPVEHSAACVILSHTAHVGLNFLFVARNGAGADARILIRQP